MLQLGCQRRKIATLQKLALLDNKTITDFIKSKLFAIDEKHSNVDDIQSIIDKLDRYFIPLLQTSIMAFKFIDASLGDKIDASIKQKIINEVIEKIKK